MWVPAERSAAPVCPECGAAFDPLDPDTFADPARPKRTRPLLPLKPPSIPYVAMVILLTMLVIVLRGSAGVFYADLVEGTGPVPGVLAVAVALVVVDYVRRRAALIDRRVLGETHLLERFNRHIGRWRLTTVCLILTLSAIVYPWPACLRFYVSWPWFAARADDYLQNRHANTGPQWVGLWHVEYIWGRGQGFVWFQFDHRGTGDRVGVVRYHDSPAQSRARVWVAPSWYFEQW